MPERPPAPGRRPAVSVVVAFRGSSSELAALVLELGRLQLRRGDEVIIANNGDADSHGSGDEARVRVCRARGLRAPGFARNRAAELASGEWLLFIDADTLASPTLLDDYFEPVPHPTTGVLAGTVLDIAIRTTATARHGVARARLSQARTLQRGERSYAQTANCAVRSAAFAQVGGFRDEIRAGEDADLCFRLAAAGWQFEQRPNAVVHHRSRETIVSLVRQLAVHGSGAAWLNRGISGLIPGAQPGIVCTADRSRRAARCRVAGGPRARASVIGVAGSGWSARFRVRKVVAKPGTGSLNPRSRGKTVAEPRCRRTERMPI